MLIFLHGSRALIIQSQIAVLFEETSRPGKNPAPEEKAEMVARIPYWIGISLGVVFIVAVGDLGVLVCFSSNIRSGCDDVRNCTYRVRTDGFFYLFDYMIAGKSRCELFCTDPNDISSCPVNGSACLITSWVKRRCFHQALGQMLNCLNTGSVIGVVVTGAIFLMTFPFAVGFVILAAINVKVWIARLRRDEDYDEVEALMNPPADGFCCND